MAHQSGARLPAPGRKNQAAYNNMKENTMNKKQLLSLILSVIMMLSISFPAGVLADGEEGEPAEQEPIVLVEEQEEEPAAEEDKDGDENPEPEEPKDAAITITTQPTSKTAVAGEQVKLSVAATTTSGTLTYQWQYKKKTEDDTAWKNASGKAAEWNHRTGRSLHL